MRVRLSLFAAFLAAGLCAAPPASAQTGLESAVSQADVADTAVRYLKSQGYEVIRVQRTMLGRVRIEALKEGMLRELVFDRGSGELLRDRVEPAPAGQRPPGFLESLNNLFNSWGAEPVKPGEGDG